MQHDSLMDLLEIVDQPSRRRSWLLAKALETCTFDQALDLARTAEEFIAGTPALGEAGGERPLLRPAPATGDEIPSSTEPVSVSAPPHRAGSTRRRCRLTISPECRAQLIDRLAEGAENAALATEFGLGPRQVQGMRMGAAREIAARRRQQQAEHPAPPDAAAALADVVLYLRRQDDVVVGQEDGRYLVNGRFRLTPSELVARANRMRQRQGKPSFRLSPPGTESNQPTAAMQEPIRV